MTDVRRACRFNNHPQRVPRGLLLSLVVAGAMASTEASAAPFNCPSPDAPGREKRARALFEEAVPLEASDPEGALVRYQCAAKLSERPAIELRIGVVAERLHKDDVAIVAFERYLELAGTNAPDYEKMRAHVKELRDKPKPTPEPEKPETAPSPPPAPPPPSRTSTYVGWGLVGTGVALAVAGSAFLVVAKSKSDDVHDLPAGTVWASDQARGAYESAVTSQTIGVVLLAIAPAALIAGGTLLFTSGGLTWPSSATKGSTAVAASPFSLRF